MSEQDNIQTAQKWLEALGEHDIAALKQLRGPGYVVEHPALPGPVGGDEEDEYLERLTDALPDWHWEVTTVIAQGDYVVINGIRRGTQQGPLNDMGGTEIVPATGREMALPISVTLKFENGKIVRSSVYYDRLSMLKQLNQIVTW